MTYEKYEAFLGVLKDSSKYLVVPLNKFLHTIDSTHIVIGIRHDVDVDFEKAKELARIEHRLGIQASYYFLHTAAYYYTNPADTLSRLPNISSRIADFQYKWKHEVGFHNDLVSLQLIYKQDPKVFLKNELKKLREIGLQVTGTASHGAPQLRPFQCLNYYFFAECDDKPFNENFKNLHSVTIDQKDVKLAKGTLKEFDFDYEAYFINNTHYFSDVKYINSKRWNMSFNDWQGLKPGDRAIILIHPEHWDKATNESEFEKFTVEGQVNQSVIDVYKRTVDVVFRHGDMIDQKIINFITTKGTAAVFVNNMPCISGITTCDLSKKQVFKLESANCKTINSWSLNVHTIPNNEAEIVGIKLRQKGHEASINQQTRTITIAIDPKYRNRKTNIILHTSQFATVCKNGKPLKNKRLRLKPNSETAISILSEDGSVEHEWKIIVT